MSMFVLKREYELQLPNNYIEIDRDEMEYIDGGLDWKTYVAGVATGVVGNILYDILKYSGSAALQKFGVAAIGGTVGWVIAGVAVSYGIVKFTNSMLKAQSSPFYNGWVNLYNSHRYCCNSMNVGKH